MQKSLLGLSLLLARSALIALSGVPDLLREAFCIVGLRGGSMPRFARLLLVSRKVEASAPTTSEVLITTDVGCWSVSNGVARRLLRGSYFGIEISDGRLFTILHARNQSFLLRIGIANHRGSEFRVNPADLRVLHAWPGDYTTRVHQISASRGKLFIAVTGENRIDVIDANSGSRDNSIFPFRDEFGAPVQGHAHHINSLHHDGQRLWFLSHNRQSGRGSRAGFIDLENLDVYSIETDNRGCHDIFPTRKALVVLDTFGSESDDFQTGGGLIINHRREKPPINLSPLMLRGIAGVGEDWILGTSFHGKRQDRYRGNGGLALIDAQGEWSYFEMPWSQTYDMICADGSKFIGEDGSPSPKDAKNMLKMVGNGGYKVSRAARLA